jgi:hypothetical protein
LNGDAIYKKYVELSNADSSNDDYELKINLWFYSCSQTESEDEDFNIRWSKAFITIPSHAAQSTLQKAKILLNIFLHYFFLIKQKTYQFVLECMKKLWNHSNTS